ncbi:hypothetical protein D9N00_14130 [Pseudomonas syringae pv. actinidiae]|nr:hypothetical protein D9N00_14130 [Pseudomonas syringae pv. actinidiae]AYL84155.1 hypothetical protein CN228_16655 [Pseudomonas syringae pv. actinidiae str. Shaanxi_M228]
MGRRASRTACDAERRTIVVSVLQHNVMPGPQSLPINKSAFLLRWH